MRLIKNGQVLIDNRLEKKDILIDEGKIIQIDDSILKDCDTVDATGLTVIPGLVDVHEDLLLCLRCQMSSLFQMM